MNIAALCGLLSLAAMGGGCAAVSASSATRAPCDANALAYVGTDSGRVQAVRVDACAGRITLLGEVALVPKPRWITPHPTVPVVYVASDGQGSEGSVVAFARDRASGALTKLNEVGSGGAGTTHLTFDAPSNTLLASNFGGGSVSSLAVQASGLLGARISTIKATGAGPHRRQASPHAHAATVDPAGRFVLVADLGADRLFVYGFDRTTRALTADEGPEPRSWAAPAGSGPRQAMFDAAGQTIWLLHELTAEVSALRWDHGTARPKPLQTLPLSAAGFTGTPSGSAMAGSRDGRFVYAADRAGHALVVLRADPATGALAPAQRIGTGGETPWALDIDASGRWLLVANQRSGGVRLFAIDGSTGLLVDSGQSVDIAAPLSIAFIPRGDTP